jgi:hypothetical protein
MRLNNIQEDESVALEKVPAIAEYIAGRREGPKCKPGIEPQVPQQLPPPPAAPESSDECAMHDASLEVTQLFFEDRCSNRSAVGD